MPQLKAYHRPKSIDQALALLARPTVETAIIAGGSTGMSGLGEQVDEVLDLQSLGLTAIEQTDDRISLGAMTRLQTIVDDVRMPELVRTAAYRTGPNTLRNSATIGGAVVAASSESELLAALLVCGGAVQVEAKDGVTIAPLGQFFANMPAMLGNGLVTAVSFSTAGQTASDRVARTPADSPIVAAAARRNDDGEIRLALCGVADTPILVAPDQVEALNPAGDFRGSTEYRRQMAVTLAGRVVDEISG